MSPDWGDANFCTRIPVSGRGLSAAGKNAATEALRRHSRVRNRLTGDKAAFRGVALGDAGGTLQLQAAAPVAGVAGNSVLSGAT
jgi:hypothetical protein